MYCMHAIQIERIKRRVLIQQDQNILRCTTHRPGFVVLMLERKHANSSAGTVSKFSRRDVVKISWRFTIKKLTKWTCLFYSMYCFSFLKKKDITKIAAGDPNFFSVFFFFNLVLWSSSKQSGCLCSTLPNFSLAPCLC